MKKYLIILVVLNSTVNLFAQNEFKEFAPLGATWYYDRQEMLPYDARGYIRYTVERDTLIDSKIMKIISINGAKYNSTENFWGFTFIYVEKSKVYHYVENELILVYDFTLKVGDTLSVTVMNDCDSVTPIVLDSIGIIIFENDTLNVQYFSYNQRLFEDDILFERISFDVIEQVGCISGFLYKPSCAEETLVTSAIMRCYTDNEIHYVAKWWNDTYLGADCDEIINNTAVPTNKEINLIKAYPNPVIDFLNLDYNGIISTNTSIELYNIYGEKLTVKKNCNMIDMNNIPSGVYLLLIIGYNNNEVFKIVKQ